ncbi:MAG: hypothetical protein V7K97_18320 [Nostoc sp.]|uniref:hypothetical protein n=1 Tax=Nostoc sp. TaxID=1180 RepID=UPI002FF65D60
MAIAQDPRLHKSCRGSIFTAIFGKNETIYFYENYAMESQRVSIDMYISNLPILPLYPPRLAANLRRIEI